MDSDESTVPIQKFTCPKCKQSNAIETMNYFGLRSFLCPDCDHHWLDPPQDD